MWASPAQEKGHGGAEAVSWAGLGRMRGWLQWGSLGFKASQSPGLSPGLGQMSGLPVKWVRILAGQQACSLTWVSSASSSGLCLSPSTGWCPRQAYRASVRPRWPGWTSTAPCLLSGKVREPPTCPVGCPGLRAEDSTLLRPQVQPAFKIA